MKRGIIAMACLVAISIPLQAGASFIEDRSGVYYQNDGGIGRDSSDVCEAGPQAHLPLGPGGHVEAQLMPIDDVVDHFEFFVPDELLGQPMGIFVTPIEVLFFKGTWRPEVRLEVLGPGCLPVAAFHQPPPGNPETETESESEDGSHDRREVVFFPDVPGQHRLRVTLVDVGTPEADSGTGTIAFQSPCYPFCEFAYCAGFSFVAQP